MRVDRLVAEQFRNIEQLRLEPHPGANVIFGDNAQGKTNLLEAIWLFCGAKSFRGAKEKELVRLGQDMAHLNMTFHAEGRTQTADLAFGPEKKKVRINEVEQPNRSSLSGRFCAVLFSPDQLSMVKQGPEGRRRFLDASLCQIFPKYQKVLESYERILRQRSFLLRDCAAHPVLLDTLDAWDNHLIRYGAYIVSARVRYTARLEEAAKEFYSGISSGKEAFTLSYQSALAEESSPDRELCAKALQKAVADSRSEDLRVGATTVGPHRDDLSIQIGGLGARSFASQGQQRSCVIALKLAECELIAQAVGEPPVILLDDVMSELDESRRSYLLNHLSGRQVFITCCDTGSFEGLKDGKTFQISGGALVRAE